MNPGLILATIKASQGCSRFPRPLRRNAATDGSKRRVGPRWDHFHCRLARREVLMVADSERRDAEDMCQISHAVQGLAWLYLRTVSHTPTHQCPGTLGVRAPWIPYIHTHIQLTAAGIMCETLWYWAGQRHTIYSATIVNVHACGMFFISSQSFTPPVEQVCEDVETSLSLNERLLAKQWVLPVSVLFNSRQQEQDLQESCQTTH